MRERVVRRRGQAHHVEVAHEARRDGVSSAARWCRCHHQRRVLDVLPEPLRPVVEALEVQELAQQLDGRLRAVLLHRWHVHIVHHHHYLPAHRRTQQRAALLLELAFDGALRDGARGASAEVQEHRQDGERGLAIALSISRGCHSGCGCGSWVFVAVHVLRAGITQRILQDDRLAGAGDSRQKHRCVDGEEPRQHLAVPHRVSRRHQHLEVRQRRVVGERRHDVVPGPEATFTIHGLHEVVLQQPRTWHASLHTSCLQQRTREAAELRPVHRVNAAAD